MTESEQGNEQLIKAFEMMWGKFPEPVMLIHRDRTILAVNKFCKDLGGLPGTKCNAVQPENHKGCKANQALDTNEAVTVNSKIGETPISGYWIPVAGVPNYFIHFGIGILKAQKAMQTSPE
ncbi:hypothetical protein REC12_05015 [Desulfosporosinus sp. PR]|uniref:hypothetical protein n=1 Tax=Candidatus Desulfosporosinus nitrosoreducens TaxID=3401928 RepID=UPI0027F17929|nr:hypothetical protein [Desulfosporosinus sp. PR]MDQ7092941.1 hypothetical protein [Desulfosporosinus sp. PR]